MTCNQYETTVHALITAFPLALVSSRRAFLFVDWNGVIWKRLEERAIRRMIELIRRPNCVAINKS